MGYSEVETFCGSAPGTAVGVVVQWYRWAVEVAVCVGVGVEIFSLLIGRFTAGDVLGPSLPDVEFVISEFYDLRCRSGGAEERISPYGFPIFVSVFSVHIFDPIAVAMGEGFEGVEGSAACHADVEDVIVGYLGRGESGRL